MAPVIDLDAVRGAHDAPVTAGVSHAFTRLAPTDSHSCARTAVLQAACLQADVEVYRHIGVDTALSLGELAQVVDVCFGFASERGPQVSGGEVTTPHFCLCGTPLPSSDPIAAHLREPGDQLTYHWGLWKVQLNTVGTYPRDEHTPRALCVGGSGSFTDQPPSMPLINAELTGHDAIATVMAQIKPGLARVIRRSGLTEFVQLLQALDLDAPVSLPAATVAELRRLPVEDGPDADAFWATALALACLSAPATDEITLTTMRALGHTPATAADVHAACAASLDVLARAGGCGKGRLPVLERIDVYRVLFHRA